MSARYCPSSRLGPLAPKHEATALHGHTGPMRGCRAGWFVLSALTLIACSTRERAALTTTTGGTKVVGSPTTPGTAAPAEFNPQGCDERAGDFDPDYQFPRGEVAQGGVTADAPQLVYATSGGVFVSSDGAAPQQLAELADGQSVYDLTTSEDGRLAAWVTDSIDASDRGLWLADLSAGALVTWPGVGAEDDMGYDSNNDLSHLHWASALDAN